MFGQGLVVAVVNHPGTFATRAAVGGFERRVVKGTVVDVTRAAGGALNDVDVSQVERSQVLDDVGEERLGLGIVHVIGGRDWRQADAGLAAAHSVCHGAGDFQREAGAVFDAAAVVVGALVAAAFHELVEQVAVGAVDLDAVKAGCLDRVARRCRKGMHDAGDFADVERARLGGFDKSRHAAVDQHGLGLGGDSRRRDRLAAVGLQAGVRDTPHVPELHNDLAALGMHRAGHFLPGVKLLSAIETRHVGITLALMADSGAFGDQEAGAGALAIVNLGDIGRHGIGRAVPRERRHHDAVGKGQVTGFVGVE